MRIEEITHKKEKVHFFSSQFVSSHTPPAYLLLLLLLPPPPTLLNFRSMWEFQAMFFPRYVLEYVPCTGT